MSPIPASTFTRFATTGRLCFSPFHNRASTIMGTTTAIAVMTDAGGDNTSPWKRYRPWFQIDPYTTQRCTR
jgi:hypothetical protein